MVNGNTKYKVKGTNGKFEYCGIEDNKLAHFLTEYQELENLRDEIGGGPSVGATF